MWLGPRTRHLGCPLAFPLLVLLAGLLVSACGSPGRSAQAGPCGQFDAASEPGLQAVVRCLLAGEDSVGPVPVVSDPRVALYLDLSASMRGFLDPAYSNPAFDFRRLLDTLVLRLDPIEIFGFGSTLRPLAGTLGVLGSPATYSDSHTRLELVLDQIRADTQLTQSHIVLGDGRRDTPEESRSQFADMSRVARRWIEGGGVFVVAAALPPFRTVAQDPAGCGLSAETEAAEQRCPLYLFAFVRSVDLPHVAVLVHAAFEHFFVWPVPGDLLLTVEKSPDFTNDAGGAGVQFEPRWVRIPDGHVVPRLRSREPMSSFASLVLRVADIGDAGRSAWHSALVAQLPFDLGTSLINLREGRMEWREASDAAGRGVVRVEQVNLPTVSVRATGSTGQPTLVRFEGIFRPHPEWVRALNAPDRRDPVRTLGLDLLFIGLPAQSVQQSPHAFLLLN